MSRIQFFERDLQIATANMSPAALAKLLANGARKALAQEIASGHASKVYDTYVDGVEGASEDSAKPQSTILYEFRYLEEIAEFARDLAVSFSPVKSGAYRDAWFFVVDGRQVDTVPPHANQFVLTNPLPYARKIDTGAMPGMSVPPGIVEKVRQQVNARFGNYAKAERDLITLSNGYVLKGKGRTIRADHHGKHIANGKTAKESRKDTAAGQLLTYPALVVDLRQ